jgi:CRISPR/Cas system-associated exonuclease Cas4 (RecB family)
MLNISLGKVKFGLLGEDRKSEKAFLSLNFIAGQRIIFGQNLSFSIFERNPMFPLCPPTFQFTQSNLQDFLTCQRRFELRYLRQMNWPAVESAPIHEAERRMQLGSDFHRLVHQHLLGLPEAELTEAAQGIAELTGAPELILMWQNYLTHRPAELAQPGLRLYPEITLSTMVDDYRLVAKYDLIAFLPGEAPQLLILDWKTSSKRPDSQRLRNRVQSRVYPFVLVKAGASLNDNQPLNPANITMIYWFAVHPTQPEVIPYDQTRFTQDQAYLSKLIQEITTASDFPLTNDQKACRYCVYRSYCDRGQTAGSLDEIDDDLELDELALDWEQISEIAY